MVILFAPRAKSPPETVKPPVAVATVVLALPSNETPPIVRAVLRTIAFPAIKELAVPLALVRVTDVGVPRIGATSVRVVPSVVAPVIPPNEPAILY